MKRKTLLLFVLFIGIYCRAQVKTYVCKYSLDGKERTDYIKLTFKNDTLAKGVYCGNWDGIGFVADIETSKHDDYNLNFHLKNYKFSKKPVTPYARPHYIKISPNDDDLPTEFDSKGREVNSYWGTLSDKKLLLKVAMWFYDSRTDELIFNRIEPEKGINTYVCKYTFDGKERTDHIQLTFKNYILTKGVYYGNWDGVGFVADIDASKFEGVDGYTHFHLKNYKFSKEFVAPYLKPNYFETNENNLPEWFNCWEGSSYSYRTGDEKLLLRMAMCYYSGRFDELIFNKVGDE